MAERSEEDFHTAIKENSEDAQLLLVFADWLQERDDPRAEGYRVMGTYSLRPNAGGDWFHLETRVENKSRKADPRSDLPALWIRFILNEAPESVRASFGVWCKTARVGLDLAATAWSLMTDANREGILKILDTHKGDVEIFLECQNLHFSRTTEDT